MLSVPALSATLMGRRAAWSERAPAGRHGHGVAGHLLRREPAPGAGPVGGGGTVAGEALMQRRQRRPSGSACTTAAGSGRAAGPGCC